MPLRRPSPHGQETPALSGIRELCHWAQISDEISTRLPPCPWENVGLYRKRLVLHITPKLKDVFCTLGPLCVPWCTLGCRGRLFCRQPGLTAQCLRPTFHGAPHEVTHKGFTTPSQTHPSRAPFLFQGLIYFIKREREKSHSRKENHPAD